MDNVNINELEPGWAGNHQSREPPISALIGRTIVSIDGKVGDDDLRFTCSDGAAYRMYHSQGCCEGVALEDIAGDLSDLIGSPVTLAEEVTNSEENPPDAKPETVEYQDSFTWTFYKIGTAKGVVTLRWYGESNGYYSESVDFVRVLK